MLKLYSRHTIIIILLTVIFISISFAENFSHIRYQNEMHEWRVLKTLHFDIYYTDESVDLAVLCSRYAEENNIYISNYLNYELNNVVNIVISQHGDTYNLKNHFKYIRANKNCKYSDSGDNYLFLSFNGSHNDFRKELTHKLVHCFQYEILFDESPWHFFSYNSLSDYSKLLTEAIAEYIASGYNEYDDIVINDLISSILSTNSMEIRLYDLINNDIVPELGKSFYYFVEKQYGEQEISDILWNSISLDLTEAIEKALNSDIDKIYSGWINFFKKRHHKHLGQNRRKNKSVTTLKKSDEKFFNIPLSSANNSNIYFLFISNNVYEVYKGDIQGNKYSSIFKYVLGEDISNLQDAVCSSGCPSISPKTAKVVYIEDDGKRDIIVLRNLNTGKIINKIKLPFNKIKDVSLSPDGMNIAFIGVSNISSDIYIYNIMKESIIQVTDDIFSERYPEISYDNSFIVYCSNENKQNDPEEYKYQLVKYDININKQTVIDSQKNILHPQISADGRRIFYSANTSGVYNIYSYDVDSDRNLQITDLQSGAFFPYRLPGKRRILYAAFTDNELNIYSSDFSEAEISQVNNFNLPEYKNVKYPSSYFDSKDTVLTDYKDYNNSLVNVFVSGSSIENNYLLNADIHLTDYLNTYRLITETDYCNIEDESYTDINIEYDYLKYRTDFGLGLYYKSNPFYTYNKYYSDSIKSNLKFYYRNPDTEEYGTYLFINYPIYKKIYLSLKTSWTKNDNTNSFFSYTEDDRYLNTITALLGYDSLIVNNSQFAEGTQFDLSYSNSIDITGNDYRYNIINVNFIKALNIYNRLFFVINGEYGRISGSDKNEFTFYLGGLYAIRGHDPAQYSGYNAFLVQTEIKFLLLKRVLLKPFLPMKLRNICIVLFFDAGSAWNEEYDFMDSSGEFKDFKSGTGVGIRFQLIDHLLFKLDVAWPYFYKSFGNNQIIAGFDFHY